MSGLEVHRLYKLRVDVFVHEQRCPYAEIDATDALETTTHLLVIDGDELLGTARLFPSALDGRDVAQFGRFALAPAARGTGVGPAIMEAAIEHADGPIYLEAQAPLVGYYSRFGFTVCGEEFDDEGVPHVPMIRG